MSFPCFFLVLVAFFNIIRLSCLYFDSVIRFRIVNSNINSKKNDDCELIHVLISGKLSTCFLDHVVFLIYSNVFFFVI